MEILADKLRPQKLDDVIGQEHLIGPGKILTNLVNNKKKGRFYFINLP